MSFIQNKTGRGYAPGWLLAEEKCSRHTFTIKASDEQAVTIGDSKIVPMGALISAVSGTGSDAVTTNYGFLNEDVEVTNGDAPGSVVTAGVIYEDRLPAEVPDAAKSALTGIAFMATSSVVRP